MTQQKRLVLDANILLRAVFGVRVRNLLETYEDSVSFYAPDICVTDARKYIPPSQRGAESILPPESWCSIICRVWSKSLTGAFMKNTRLPPVSE
jgi:hypothetical protein